jgi:hypothetical protein
MIDKDIFIQGFFRPFTQNGFKRKGNSCYLPGERIIVVVNLQRSDWGPRYFINIGFWIKDFGDESFPSVFKCPLNYRVERLFPERQELISESCYLPESNNQLIENLYEFVELDLLPFLRNCTELEFLRALLKQGKLEKGVITLEARMFLSD